MKDKLIEKLSSIHPGKIVFDDAMAFIDSMPDDLPLPELGITDAGDVTFEWAKNARRIVTAIVDGSDMVHYSALLGAASARGCYSLEEQFSPMLRDLIARVLHKEVTE